jgi:hypothetical protein
MRRGRGMGDCLLSTLLPDGSCPDGSMFVGGLNTPAPVTSATSSVLGSLTTLSPTVLLVGALALGMFLLSKGGR